MKKRIGIVTITEGCNYGNRLQNWALQTVINELGYSTTTLFHYTRNVRWYMAHVKDFIKQIFFWMLNKENSLAHYKRLFNFFEYNKKYIFFSDLKIVDNKVIGDGIDDYGKFVVGSDQVWNTDLDIIPPNLETYFLRFVDRQKRIAYAASFGRSKVDDTYCSKIQSFVQEFNKISVREIVGEKIVYSMTEIHVPVVLDPTLLIDKNQWLIFAKKPDFANTKYILTYFLDDTLYSKEIIKKIEKKFPGLNVINLRSEFYKCKSKKDLYEYLVNPNEFVWLIANAQFVYTDSFHATVFSVIFGKAFMVYKRCSKEGEGMEGRLASLLGMFNLTDKMGEFDGILTVPSGYDVSKTDEIINIEKEKSIKYLKDALE